MNIPELGIFEGMDHQRIEKNSPDTLAIIGSCKSCGVRQRVVVPDEGWKRWKTGAYIQDALPMLSADIRELLISGYCGNCFDDICKDEE